MQRHRLKPRKKTDDAFAKWKKTNGAKNRKMRESLKAATAPDADPGEFLVPWGKLQGRPLKSLSLNQLGSLLALYAGRGKDSQRAVPLIRLEIQRRGPDAINKEVQQQERRDEQFGG